MSPLALGFDTNFWLLVGAGMTGLWTGAVLVMSRLPDTRIARRLRWFAVSGALWAAGDLIASLATTLFWKEIGIAILYSGLIFLPPLWWSLALGWAEGRGAGPGLDARRWTRLPLLWAGATWLLMLTNPWHGQFLLPVVGGRNLYRPLWWLMAIPNYALILGVVVLELQVLRRVRSPEARRQGAFLITAGGFVLAMNWLYVGGVFRDTHATPLVLGVAGVILAVGMYREGLFGVLPMALPVIAFHAPDGVIVLRPDGRLVYANPKARALLAPLVLTTDEPLVAGLARRLLRSDGARGATPAHEWERLWPAMLQAGGSLFRDGDARWLRVSGRSVYARGQRLVAQCLHIHDATDEQRAESERHRARRLESVAELARGVAHDFHNLLAVVMGNAELLAGQLPRSPEIQRKLEKILRSGRQARELADQLQLYAGAVEPKRDVFDLSALVRDVSEVLDPERAPGPIGVEIEARLELAEGPVIVEADATQLRQLVLNLVANSRDALADQGGQIRIQTGRTHLDPRRCENLVVGMESEAGVYAFLRVSDTGPGMDAETQERVFEPFFSTKGKHRGIGLSTVLGIVRSHDALLELVSGTGEGTAFTVYFALADVSAASTW
jgi:signal transduction histidine kinase